LTLFEDTVLRRIFEYQGGGSKGKRMEIIFVLTKRIRLIRVVKARRMSTEYRKDTRHYKEVQKPGRCVTTWES
jgi:hypothetical protein